MMGTGKTAVGRALAQRLGRPFYDTDHLIESREGRSVAAIFETEGELYFRDVESAVIRETTAHPAAVIATGGGALLRRENRERLNQRGLLVWLKADLHEMTRRVSMTKNKRPLLKGTPQAERLKQLLTEREPLYAEAAVTVETTGKSVGEVVSLIVGRLRGHPTTQQEE
ncbi:MAG: shikimate kinase [Nitrospirae bacterium]|nr:shikimate kinase [Nitrospirota bacterium]